MGEPESNSPPAHAFFRRFFLAIHLRYLPRPPLSAFVEQIWLYEGDMAAPRPTKERRLPDGSISLIINLYEDQIRIYDRRDPERFQSYGGAVINGAHSEFVLIDRACQVLTMGVEFKPGGVFPFLRFPADELRNQVLSLEILWGAEIADLRGRLIEAGTPEGRFQILERFLLERLALSRSAHPAVAFALKELRRMPAGLTIAELSEQIGISHARFIQLFREAVGLTPKQFYRVLRFQEVLRLLERDEPLDWVDLALRCGYFDQAHFIHDFLSFSGLTPTSYLGLRGEYYNHIALPAEL